MNKFSWIEESIRLHQGLLTTQGALSVQTGKFTGRSASTRWIVDEASTRAEIGWNASNRPIQADRALILRDGVDAELEKHKSQIFHSYVGPFRVRVRSNSPWHLAFCQNMFRARPIENSTSVEIPTIEVFHLPFHDARKWLSDLKSEAAVVLNMAERSIVIVGTAYAGEIKKGVFSVANFLLPIQSTLPMHASANCLSNGSQTSILFGLSGTGKTTLSSVEGRYMIGDDEIAWSKTGVFNLEGGCYAKLIGLTEEREPEIYRAVNSYGSIVENVVVDPNTHLADFEDSTKTENTRGSYPLDSLENVFDQNREADPPDTLVFLMADAFGAMPAIARLDHDQALQFFLAGYTAKVAGTEMGVKEPVATFSPCFGAPFMPRSSRSYANMLRERLESHPNSSIWLLNTGWSAGGYAKGERFPLKVTRAILKSAQDGALAHKRTTRHPDFGFEVPVECPGIESKWMSAPQGQAVNDLLKRFEEHERNLDD